MVLVAPTLPVALIPEGCLERNLVEDDCTCRNARRRRTMPVASAPKATPTGLLNPGSPPVRTCVDVSAAGLSPRSPTGCSPTSTGHGRGLRARRGGPARLPLGATRARLAVHVNTNAWQGVAELAADRGAVFAAALAPPCASASGGRRCSRRCAGWEFSGRPARPGLRPGPRPKFSIW